ncbi:MAG TPA: short chain dehydrogenase, partial [Dehalococcoidia bacterium]|nr:short chain dehydrogenase [Dehalococcoidia bacterium]
MGRAAARRLAAAGAAVVVNDLSVDSAVATATGILGAGGRSIAIGGNVTDAVEISALVAGAESKFGGVHILVNAAGVLRRTSVYDMQEDEWD